MFLLKSSESYCFWYLLNNDNLKQKCTIFLERFYSFVWSIDFQVSLFLIGMIFKPKKEGNFCNSVRNVSLSNFFDVHCREVLVVASLSPKSNVELLLDFVQAGKVLIVLNWLVLVAKYFEVEKNWGDLCVSLCGELILCSFSTILPCLSNIMLTLLTESSLNISLLFRLKYAAILSLTYILDHE